MSKELVVFADRAVSAPGEHWRQAGRRVETYLAALGVHSSARAALVARVIAVAASRPAWASAEQASGEAMRCLRAMLAERYRMIAGREAEALSTVEAAAAWRALVWLQGRPEKILNENLSIDTAVLERDVRGRARLSSMPPMRRAPMAPKRPHLLSLRWLSRLFGRG